MNGFIREEWLDNIYTDETKKIRESEKILSVGPSTVVRTGKKEYVTSPCIYQYTFSGGVIFNISTASFINKSRLITERANKLDDNRNQPNLLYTAGLLLSNLTKNIKRCPSGIYLGGNACGNYYHWMVEILPKIEFINELNELHLDYNLLVPNCLKKYPPLKDALECCSNGRKLIYLKEKSVYCADKVIYFSTPSLIPFNLKKNNRFRIDDFRIQPKSIQYVRKKIIEYYNIKPTRRTRKIFLAQTKSKRAYNEEDTYKIFEKRGFEKIFMGNLSLHEQIKIMNEADVIAGPTGASWTNMIFCQPGTKGLCWMPEFMSDFSSFSNIANLIGINLFYIYYTGEAHSTSDVSTSAYKIDIDKLENYLSKII